MSILKKSNLLLLLLITLQVFSNNISAENSNFFLSGNYKEQGVKINYSAIVRATVVKNFNGNKQLALQLSSFLIEDAKYDNRVYRDNDIFGISFPIDTAVEITAQIQLVYGTKQLNKAIILHPNKKTFLDLNTGLVDFNETKLKIKNTVSLKALFKHETFITAIKKGITNNTKRKDSEVIEMEHTRLMILGNSYLNENNYTQAVSTYLHAKKFATDISYADAQIVTTAKYAQKDNIIIDTNRKLQTTVNKSHYTDKQPSIVSKSIRNNNRKTPATIKSVKESSKIKYQKDKNDNEYEYTTHKTNEPVYAVNSSNHEDAEYEYEYEDEVLKEASTIFDDQQSEYEYDEVQVGNTTNYDQNEFDAEYEDENGNAITVKNNSVTNVSSTKASSYTSQKKPTTQKPNVKPIVSNQSKKEDLADVKEPSNENYEVIRTKKGYIKYKKDEQAVVDIQGNILIPYGKHEIIRYKAGFARIKVKDDVEIKNIVCINKNEEYNWSARIYENPWKETVIDKNGSYVDKITKKVEIYIVDNVTNIPNYKLSAELLKSYEDPNPFKGTQQISASNLWNRNNSNKPSVIETREKIKRLKQVSKDNAFQGAEECRNQVSKRFEEVFDYYQKMDYEIILKD